MLDCRQIDTLMMDWLYGELAPSEHARFDQHVLACVRCKSEVDTFARTRDALRALPEDDPPPALSAILLHEAAHRAPAVAAHPQGKPAVWAWLLSLFRPLVLHPAGAAVATLVVAVGAAGALYLRGEKMDSVATPEPRAGAAARPSTGASDDAARTPPAQAGEAAPVALRDEIQRPPSDFEDDPDRAEGRDREYPVRALDEAEKQTYGLLAETVEPELKTLDERPAKKARPASGEAAPGDGNAPRVNRAGREPAPVLQAPVANAVSSADALLDESEMSGFAQGRVRSQPPTTPIPAKPADSPGPVATDKMPGKAPVARGAPELAVAKDATEGGAGPAPAPTRDDRSQAWAKAKEQEMHKAIRAKDCRGAARIAADISDRDRGYYLQRIQNARAFKSCQAFIDREQRQRAQRRAKTKGKSAPEFDDNMAAEQAAE